MLTNTYFEGDLASNPKAWRGHSKEKRSDCPLVTFGLVLDGSGFVRRSEVFSGNISEGQTLSGMLAGLNAPAGALVVMDRGIFTQADLVWLREQGYRYLVVSRERSWPFDPDQATSLINASGERLQLEKTLSEAGHEVKLYCYSERRADKENGIHQHYRRQPVEGSALTHPGVYVLRSSEMEWDTETLWSAYSMLTDLEAVFRSLKSELGLRPILHHTEKRADGHLFITVLAYQFVQILRRQLQDYGILANWSTVRQWLSSQVRVTAVFQRSDGRALHVRKAT
jgi:transposase